MKTIVIDMDYTLLTSKQELTDRTRNVLLKAQENGHKVVLASGRPTRGMVDYIEPLKLDKYSSHLISFNGATIVDAKTRGVVFNENLSVDLTQRVLKHLESFDVEPVVYYEDYIHVNDIFGAEYTVDNKTINPVVYESRTCNYLLREHKNLASFVDFKNPKVLVCGVPDYLARHHKEMSRPFENECTTNFSEVHFFEFMRKGVDKGETLKVLTSELNIDLNDVIAFGDGGNDVNMLRVAGLGVAMSNATDEAKKYADVVTLSNDEEGVAVFLEEYLSL